MVTALLLAGKRDGKQDPLAFEESVSHKCLVSVAGRPMILHVLHALASAPAVEKIVISIDDPTALASLPELHELEASGRLTVVTAHENLVESIFAAAETAQFPMLVTTADNVLLTPDALAEFKAGVAEARADAAVAFTMRQSVLAAHPDGQRRFYKFSDGSYSNCNMYWIGNRQSLQAAEVFRSGGQFAKHPSRIISAFGLINLLRFRLGLASLSGAFRRFSSRLGMAISPVILSDGAVAIDVDNPRTLSVAESILHARREAR
jgi:GTP:adenosylcobinamide-phosphate guanylyltransferase